MNRPTFAATIHALTLTHPTRGPLHTPEEADIAEVLRDIEATHRAVEVGLGRWGHCTVCRSPWPCSAWSEAEQLAVLYLGRAYDRAAALARQHLDRATRRPA